MAGLLALFSWWRAGESELQPQPRSPKLAPPTDELRVIVLDGDADDEDGKDVPKGGPASVRNIRWEPGTRQDPPKLAGPRFTAHAGGKSDPGLRRSSNEDALLVLRESAVYAVADGMGGHMGGEIASQLAVDAIASSFLEPAPSAGVRAKDVPVRAAAPVESLSQSLGAANDAIRSFASKNRRLADMGTTVVAARFCADEGRLYVGHVGDSRCYRLRDGTLEQITRDHTMADLGVTGPGAAYLSRVVGPNRVLEADIAVLEARADDLYLLCTDGLTKMLSDDAIRDVLLVEGPPEAAAETLIARANAAGGRDNVTALVIELRTADAELDAETS